MGDLRCFDDWCIGVESIDLASQDSGAVYTAKIRLASRARRVSQREKNVVVYMSDDRGRRYDPVADPSATPISFLLGPGESVEITRRFRLPRDMHPAGLVIEHEGGFPIGWFILGDEAWFHKPTIVPIPQ